MKPTSFHNRQTDPVYARYPHLNGSWLGAVELAEDDILLLGALQLDFHVALHPGYFQGWYESGNGDWFIARRKELNTFDRYAKLLAKGSGKIVRQKPPRVWCSWYSLYDNISEKNLLEVLAGLANMPFDVFQVVDGWQIGSGDWEANAKSPSGMASFAAKVRETGKTAGLWLAPLTVRQSSTLCHERPDWLLRDVGGKLLITGFEWSPENARARRGNGKDTVSTINLLGSIKNHIPRLKAPTGSSLL